jgi:flavorubredoxin
MIVFEEMTRSLFPADLYVQSGDQPAVVRENLGKEMCQLYRGWGIFAAAEPVLEIVDCVEKLDVQWINPMHGGSLPKELMPSYTDALRSERFTFEGKLFGRVIPDRYLAESPSPY